MTRNMLNFFAKAFGEYERRGRGFGRVGEGLGVCEGEGGGGERGVRVLRLEGGIWNCRLAVDYYDEKGVGAGSVGSR